MRKENEIPQQGLYRESFEHDNCGIGAIVNIKGQKSHSTVAGALHIVENLEHRAGKDAEGKTGDGVGILTQIPHNFFKKVCQPLGIDLKGERDYGVGMFFFPQDELKRSTRISSEKVRLTVCRVSCRRLSNVRPGMQRDWNLTAGCMW